MAKQTVPEEYLIDGLEAVSYSKPDDKCEAVEYKTPQGVNFSLAKDCMGIQICKSGCFWPVFTSFPSMIDAVEYLRKHVIKATAFFNEVGRTVDNNEMSKV